MYLDLFAAAVNTNDLGSLGAPGLVVIVVVLSGVVVYREKYWSNKADKLQARLDAIQDERLTQAIETRDKLAEPMQNMSNLMQNILNAVTNGKQ